LDIPERSGLKWAIWDPMHFVMEQRMLRGIKERVENQPLVVPAIQAAAHIGWAIAGVGLFVVYASRRRRWLWLARALAASLPAVVLTGDLNSALAAFLSVGITIVGALAFGWCWWPAYLLIASAVALVLVLTPDPYTAFGLLFLTVEVAFAMHFSASWHGS